MYKNHHIGNKNMSKFFSEMLPPDLEEFKPDGGRTFSTTLIASYYKT